MPMPTISEDEKESYKRGRAALRNLEKDRNFQWWVDYGNAYITAQTEAMRRAGTNQPVGKHFNLEMALVLKRERLIIERPGKPPFPDKNTRKDAMAMIDNLQHPVDNRRLKGVLAWRAELTTDERNRTNHPTAIMRRWKNDTEPQADKDARAQLAAMQAAEHGNKQVPLDALADAESERDEMRGMAEKLRGLLGRVLKEVQDLDPTLRAEIEAALRE